MIIFAVAGCVSSASFEPLPPKNGEIIQDQEIASQIRSSSSSTMIGEVEYRIESYTWRDFMPIVDPPIRLILKNTLIRTDEGPIDSSIEVIQQYVVKGSEIWRPGDLEVRHHQSDPGRLDILSREGPTWETGSKVSVGLKIRDQQTGTLHWLSNEGIEIVRTD
jgi:hypothetical protein